MIDLPATAGASATARHLVTSVLLSWDLPTAVADTELIVSELAANAYRHAPGTDTFVLEIRQLADAVEVSIADGSATRPVLRELRDDLPSGRGLHIVGALADTWGTEDCVDGKRVWVRVGCRRP